MGAEFGAGSGWHSVNIASVGPASKRVGGMATVARMLRGSLESLGHTVIELDTIQPPFGLGSVVGVIRVCMRGTVSIAHVNVSAEGSIYREALICLLFRWFKVPYIVHIHSGRFFGFIRRHASALVLAKAMLECSAGIITLGLVWRDELIKSFPECATKARVIPNPVVRRPIANRNNANLIFIGNVIDAKGIFRLLHCFARSQHCREWFLHIVGTGKVESAQALVRDLGIGDQVTFHGEIASEEVTQLLERSTFLLLPSDAEGLPNAILEAFSAGVPVISTPVGAIPEYVEHMANGLLLSAEWKNEELVTLLDTALSPTSDDLRHRMFAGAELTRGNLLDPGGYARAMLSAYQEGIAHRES